MPVEFLTDQQAARYGRFAADLSPEQLARFFHLGEADLGLVRARQSFQSQLGFALQLGTVRFLGTFLSDPTAVPDGVLDYTARQLRIEDPRECLEGYAESPLHWAHVRDIRERFGYREFTDQPDHWRFHRWLYTRAWISAERPSVLFDHATSHLVEHRILLPGVTTLARLVSRVRGRTSDRLWRALGARLGPDHRMALEALLQAGDDSRRSELDRLRRSPTAINGTSLRDALERIEEIRALGVGDLDLSRVPAGRLDVLARHGQSVKAQAIARMADRRRIATLLAVARQLEVRATDDALNLFDQLVRKLLSKAAREHRKKRLRSLGDLDEAAIALSEACRVLLEGHAEDLAELRSAVFALVPEDRLWAAITTVEEHARAPDDRGDYDELVRRYQTVRRFLPALLGTISFQANEAGDLVLGAFKALPDLKGRRRVEPDDVALSIVPPAWRRLVLASPGEVDPKAYTLCVVERMREALTRRDVFAEKSRHWGDPRAQLLRGAAWERARPRVCRTLDLTPEPSPVLARLAEELDLAFRRVAEHLPSNSAVQISKREGRDRLHVDRLDALDEPDTLIALRKRVHELLPRGDLPDILLEVDSWTGLAGEFTHVGEGRARAKDLTTSVCATLISEACNVGLEPLVRAGIPALTRGRLSWVLQNYVRADTLRAANARLVNYQAEIPLAQTWGGGQVASADGMRFVVPVRTINAGPNPRYFGVGRGITYLNFTSDQRTGFHSIVVPGTLRDSIYILEGLLQNETNLRPVQVMTDTASYSDLVFGLFWLLGYHFCPRLADLGDARFWRIDRSADYGPLNEIGRHRINTELITSNWDDILRVAGSLALGTVPASDLVRALQAGGRPTTLGRAIAELGRIPKTLHLLAFIDDEAYRRPILVQLNHQEERHALGRVTFHGRRGEVRKAYREGQEDQLGALGLVLNAIVLWNSRYMDTAVRHLREEGLEVLDSDLERLSPLVHGHINLHGRYHFGLPEEVQRGELRPLRDPAEALDELVG